MNVENEEEYFDAIPNSPPIYTGMTSVVMHKPKISIPQHPHLLYHSIYHLCFLYIHIVNFARAKDGNCTTSISNTIITASV